MRLVLAALLFALALLAAAPLSARPSWDRGVGERQANPPSRSERRRFRLGPPTQVPLREAEVLSRVEALGRGSLAKLTLLGHADDGLPLYRIDLATARRQVGPPPLRVLVSAGIHGNEPVGVATALALVERALADRGLRERFAITVLPILNRLGQRETPAGVDLNRSFVRSGPRPATVHLLEQAIGGEHFDLFLDLHGAAKKDGFFLIRSGDDGTLSRRALAALPRATLLDADPADPTVGPYQLHALGGALTATGGTFKGFMASRGALSYTVEAPGRLSPARQQQGMMRLVRSLLENTARHGRRQVAKAAGGRL
jgi:hypothetical protein